jgi:ABC-2 type transport system permease protein
MMHLFLQELKSHRKSLIFWSIGMAVLIAMGVAKMTAYQASGEQINQLFSQLPKVFKVIFGASSDFDLSTARGFFALLFLYIAIMAAIHAALLGSEIISKEERDKTAEFLLTKPLTRSQILTAKFLAGLLNVSILTVVSTLSSVLIVDASNKGPSITNAILLLMAGMFCIQIIFYCIGIYIAANSSQARSTAQKAAAAVMVGYLIYVLVGIFDSLSWLRIFTPFQYFEAGQLLTHNTLSPVYLFATMTIVAFCVTGAYAGYARRDQTLT